VNLETINSAAQLIAALGVIASLFYLAVQIRQNTRSMRAIVVNSLAQSIADLIRPMAEDSELTHAFSASIEKWNKATPEDRIRALPLFFPTFKPGFRDYVERSEPISEVPPIGQLIRGEQ